MISKLEEAIIEMLQSEPFYAQLLLCMNKRYSQDYGLAAVSITDTINLYINPELFNQLPLSQRVGVLIHECKHITHDHISRGKKLSSKMNKALNVAADRAINETIQKNSYGGKVFADIPDELELNLKNVSEKTAKIFEKSETPGKFKPVTVKNFQEAYKDKVVENGQSMEYYYKFLKENAKNGNGSGNDFDGDLDTIDDHSSWEESEENDEVREQVVKNAIKKAVDRTTAGNLPGEVKELLDKWAQSTVNWKQQLRRFVTHAIRVKLESSRKKRHRRYGVMYPGFKKSPELNILVPVDTSASVSSEMLNQFFGEMVAISKLNVSITVMECDTQIHNEYKFDPKKPFQVTGRGGTSFKPVFDRAAQMKDIDAIIYMTDGECWDDVEYTKPTLWALCPSYNIPKGGENRHIKITAETKES